MFTRRLLCRVTFASMAATTDVGRAWASAADATAACTQYAAVMQRKPPPALTAQAAVTCLACGAPDAAAALLLRGPPAVEAAAGPAASLDAAVASEFFLRTALAQRSDDAFRGLLAVVQRLPADDPRREQAATEAFLHGCKDHDSCAALLAPLCAVLPGSRLADGLHILQLALRSGQYADAAAFDAVLALALRSGDATQVTSLWGWMQHTRAGCSRAAISTVLVARCQLLAPVRVVVREVQRLARLGLDPTPHAQLAVAEFLLAKNRPPVLLATQLFAAWAPAPSERHSFALAFALTRICHKSGELAKAEAVFLAIAGPQWAAADEGLLRQAVVYASHHVSDAAQKASVAQRLMDGVTATQAAAASSQGQQAPSAETVGLACAAAVMLCASDDHVQTLCQQLCQWAAGAAASPAPFIDAAYAKAVCRALVPFLASGSLAQGKALVQGFCAAAGLPVPEEFASWEALLSTSEDDVPTEAPPQ